MDPAAGLDRYGKSHPHRDSIPGPSSPQPVAIPTTLPGPSHVCVGVYIISLYGVMYYKTGNFNAMLPFVLFVLHTIHIRKITEF